MRPTLALVAGAVTASVGALILGEYQFTGVTPLVSGLLFGLFVAEVVVTVGRRRSRGWAGVSAALAVGGLAWAAWISVRHTHHGLPGMAWVAMAAGAVSAGLRARRPETRRADSSAAS
jgi:hypothetical protein